jgi:hypothetical protein
MGPISRVAVLTLAIPAPLVGCGGHGTPDHGTVSGTFVAMGGPAPVNGRPMPAHPLPGRVIAINGAGKHIQATVSDSGRFRLWLRPDTYRLIGYSPRVTVNEAEMQCGAVHLVHVTIGRVISHVRVICSLP